VHDRLRVEGEAVTPLMGQQLLRDSPGFLLDWDYQLLAYMLVAQWRAVSTRPSRAPPLQFDPM
jgi:hypothetical protein